MADVIQVSTEELSSSIYLIKGCEQDLQSGNTRIPSYSSDSVAMKTFMEKMFSVGVALSNYKNLLQADVATLEKTQASLEEADAAAASALGSA